MEIVVASNNAKKRKEIQSILGSLGIGLVAAEDTVFVDVIEDADSFAGNAKKKAEAFARSQLGKVVFIITEERNAAGNWEGWSDHYLRVELVGANPGENAVVPVRLTDWLTGRQMRGERAPEETP